MRTSKNLYIKSTKDFKKILKEGKKIKSPHFALYSDTNILETPRLGIRISSSNISLATKRNRIKRLIKEFWRRLKQSKYPGNIDFVIIVQKGTDNLKNEDIIEEISYIFNKCLS